MLVLFLFLFSIISVKSNNITKTVFTECNQTISQHQFILQSVGYPDGYPDNISCEYILQGNTVCATEYHFQFLDFDLENSTNCSNDRLEIQNYGSLCGYVNGIRMYKTKANLHLKFISDSSISGKGFKLLITKLPCERNNHLNNSVQRSSPAKKINLPKCCGEFYNSRRFYLASPGFPYSNQIPTECYYQIFRANPNICRLRINFKYFSNGVFHNGRCSNGYLEIDGKQICGCQTSLDVISQFDQFWGNNPKIIKYKNTGYVRNEFSGFAIEVIQDECPTRYSPSLGSQNNSKNDKVPEFYFYNDQLNRISWPNSNRTTRNTNKNDKILIDYYFFKDPESDDTKYREPRTYFETTSDDVFFSQDDNDYKCKSWNNYQFNLLTQDVLWKKMPQCKTVQSLDQNCYNINKYKGYLTNNGYPFYYRQNLNCCYRFYRIEGYCAINFYVLDFDLQSSQNCDKDAFILYNKYKYCSNSLLNSQFTFDLRYQPYEDIKFITDDYYCGRGFKIYFEQIPCENATPYLPPMTVSTTIKPEANCGGDIKSESFDIYFSNQVEQCNYIIHRVDLDVCGLQLFFLNFDLICSTEYLLINNKSYCGKMNGKSLFIEFDLGNIVNILYKGQNRTNFNFSNIVLRGIQLKGNECDPFILEVPAQRILNKI